MMQANANISDSNYNSLQVQLRQRNSHSLTHKIAYTWSKSLDDFSRFNIAGTGGPTFIPFDRTGRRLARAMALKIIAYDAAYLVTMTAEVILAQMIA